MILGILGGWEGNIFWKSSSSALNYLPSEFEQKSEVEFTHGVHLTHSGSCFSRRLFDIFLTSFRHPCKHSLGSERQLSPLNRAAMEKQTSDDTFNKTLIKWRHKVLANFLKGFNNIYTVHLKYKCILQKAVCSIFTCLHSTYLMGHCNSLRFPTRLNNVHT